MTRYPDSIRVQWNTRAVCALMNIPYEYATDMTLTAEGTAGEEAFATLTVELKRKLTKEEWDAIATLTRE